MDPRCDTWTNLVLLPDQFSYSEHFVLRYRKDRMLHAVWHYNLGTVVFREQLGEADIDERVQRLTEEMDNNERRMQGHLHSTTSTLLDSEAKLAEQMAENTRLNQELADMDDQIKTDANRYRELMRENEDLRRDVNMHRQTIDAIGGENLRLNDRLEELRQNVNA